MEQTDKPQSNKLMNIDQARDTFALTLKDAQSLDIVNNVAGAFDAAIIVSKLEAVLTDEIMDAVFMPLMNKKIGFRTDRDPSRPDKRTGIAPKPYTRDVVRTCIIDGAANGLLPTGNQWNIISGNMYPTKEGYTSLLAKLKASPLQLVYTFEFDPDTTVKSADPSYVAIPCRIGYKTSREDLKGWFKYVAMVKSNGETSTTDQLRGKAERKCKRAFYEFLTGIDLGDADATETVDVTYTEVGSWPASGSDVTKNLSAKSAAAKAKELLEKKRAAKAQEEQPQDTLNPDNMTDEQIAEYAEQHMNEEGCVQ